MYNTSGKPKEGIHMNLAFVGFKHRHTGAIYQEAMADPHQPGFADDPGGG